MTKEVERLDLMSHVLVLVKLWMFKFLLVFASILQAYQIALSIIIMKYRLIGDTYKINRYPMHIYYKNID